MIYTLEEMREIYGQDEFYCDGCQMEPIGRNPDVIFCPDCQDGFDQLEDASGYEDLEYQRHKDRVQGLLDA